jgi:outer membrane protein assembly factor BamB
MTDFPPKPKPSLAPQRLFPGPVLSGFLIVVLVIVLYLRVTHEFSETGWLDAAGANLATYAATILVSLALWSWFSFRSTYPVAWRRIVMIAGLACVVLFLATVRMEGITGNWIPTGWRFTWQKPRDFDLAKPTPIAATPAKTDKEQGDIRESPVVASPIATTPDDFPQFLGPNRDGYLPAAKLSHDWQADPPQILWRKNVGAGWSGFAVVADHAVTMEQYGDEELVVCRNLATGDVLWSQGVQARHEEVMGGIGPRCTPTIHDSKVYTQGASGIVSCLDLATGVIIWQDDLRKRYRISAAEELQIVMWGRASSPLIHGDLCIVPAGGNPPKSLIAYDRLSGERRWDGGRTQISYASPTVLTLTGKEQIVSVNESNITGHDPATGKELWAYPWPGLSNGNASASQPHLAGEGLVFISKGYDEGAAVFRVAELGGEYRTETVWKERRSLQTKFTNAVLVDGYAYGLSDGLFQCVDLATGKKQWAGGRYGHGQILGAGDVILVQTEHTGELVMLAIDPSQHRELGKFKTLNRKSQAWNNLCLAGKKLLLRNADEAICLELK